MNTDKQRAIKVFYSCSHRDDTECREQLQRLSELQQQAPGPQGKDRELLFLKVERGEVNPLLAALASGDLRKHVQTEGEGVSAAEALMADFQALEESLKDLPDEQRYAEKMRQLQSIWENRDRYDAGWQTDSAPYQYLTRRFFDLGNASLAIDVVRAATDWIAEGETSEVPFPNDVPLHQTLALALAHRGAAGQAQQIAHRLYEHHQQHPPDDFTVRETLGILARTYKDQALGSRDAATSKEKLTEALRYYQESYDRDRGIWAGINVAFCHRLLDQDDRAAAVAQQVLDDCLSSLESLPVDDDEYYWCLATLGDAAFLLGDKQAAQSWYDKACQNVGTNQRHLVSTRQQLRRIIRHDIRRRQLPEDSRQWVDRWLPTCKVAMFVGHTIDRPGRRSPRFAEQMVDGVQQAIDRWLRKNNIQFGFSSAACGSDLLFHQQLRLGNGQSYLILPYSTEIFRHRNVNFAGNAWAKRFDDAVDHCDRLITVSDHRIDGGGIGYDYANAVLEGLAMSSADDHDTVLMALAVWDGNLEDQSSGTRNTVKRWLDQGIEVHVIDPAAPGNIRVLKPGSGDQPPQPAADRDGEIEIRALLFGDAVGFSQFTEQQVTSFVDDCLVPIASILNNEFGESILHKRTTGDGFYIVFEDVRSAGNAALAINRFLDGRCGEKWSGSCLPGNLTFRLALHAGPVHRCAEPLTGEVEYTGTHVSRAARLEPETPAGQVYASEAFAAMCRGQQIKDFRCIYVQQLQWAKHYGTYPTYAVTPAD